MRRVEIMDTTLRDGAQGEGVDFSLDDKRKVALSLERLGIPLIEGGNPFASPKDAEFFESAKNQPFLTHATLVPFGSTCRPELDASEDEGLKALLHAQTPIISLFGKADLTQVRDVLRVTPEENLRMIEQSVRLLCSQGRRVYFDAEHYFDGYTQEKDYALLALRAAFRGGAECAVLCDTNGGTLPDRVRDCALATLAALPEARFGIHCHNDSGVAVAATLSAVTAGVSHAQGTVGGIGERCGNTDLCSLIPGLQLKLGYDVLSADKLSLLTETARSISEIMNLVPNPRAPYVGYSAFAHKGGMHIDGVSKSPGSFEHIPPEAVGNRRRFLLSEQAGRTGVYARMKRLLPSLTRDDERVRLVTERLKRREQRGYAYESADGSFDLMVLETLGMRKRYFDVVNFHVLAGTPGGEKSAQAYIKIAVDGREEINAAEGNGPVNALDCALRKALLVFYPKLAQMRLRDFKVRVLDSGGTASVVRVLIESTDGQNAWSTVGVSQDIIQACFKALCDSVEYYLAFDPS